MGGGGQEEAERVWWEGLTCTGDLLPDRVRFDSFLNCSCSYESNCQL